MAHYILHCMSILLLLHTHADFKTCAWIGLDDCTKIGPHKKHCVFYRDDQRNVSVNG